jgi:ActR/RegA family two-component response regulator
MQKPKLLFVDDEDSIRITLPAILHQEGFDVVTAASVAEAIGLINQQTFDILLSDLNIGQPGDGFTVVSAMRRIQPEAKTFILTGYPDFSSALLAIRNQVDDYLTKPADIPTLVKTLKTKLDRSQPHEPGFKKCAAVLREQASDIIDAWVSAVEADRDLREIRLSRKDRIDHLPDLLEELAMRLENPTRRAEPESATSQARHGRRRREQGYSASQVVQETRLLYRVIATRLQQNLLDLDISTVIPDLVHISDVLNEMLKESMGEYQAPESMPV